MGDKGYVDRDPVSLDGEAAGLSHGGLVIVDPAAFLAVQGIVLTDTVRAAMPELRQGGVDSASPGVIQDPAGAAIGTGKKPKDCGAGGVSKRIYEHFPDLEPIPDMPVHAAAFNRTTGPGRRVLHTHSPHLHGSHREPTDCVRVVRDLANSYANACIAFTDRAPELGEHGSVLNLVPLAGSIFAYDFRHRTLEHLHPSYTLTAIAVALDWLEGDGRPMPRTTLSYYGQPVYEAAEAVRL